jgi:hypothetical protein
VNRVGAAVEAELVAQQHPAHGARHRDGEAQTAGGERRGLVGAVAEVQRDRQHGRGH